MLLSPKRSIFSSFSILVLVCATQALAGDTQPPPNQPVKPREDIEMDCRFAGSFGTDKGGSWNLKCEAEARFDVCKPPSEKWNIGDRDDWFRVKCEDHHHPIYSDGIMFALQPDGDDNYHRPDVIFTGQTVNAPRILVEDLDFKHLSKERPATLRVRKFGFEYLLAGECHFRRVKPVGLN